MLDWHGPHCPPDTSVVCNGRVARAKWGIAIIFIKSRIVLLLRHLRKERHVHYMSTSIYAIVMLWNNACKINTMMNTIIAANIALILLLLFSAISYLPKRNWRHELLVFHGTTLRVNHEFWLVWMGLYYWIVSVSVGGLRHTLDRGGAA